VNVPAVPNVNVVLVALVKGPGVPVPDNETICEPPDALSVTVTAAERAPTPDGMKVTLIVQIAPGFKVAPHVFDCEKSPVFAPVTAK
jgi:hypothetical protein